MALNESELASRLSGSLDNLDVMSAARTLASLGQKAVGAAPILEELLTVGDESHASAAAFVLSELGASALDSAPGVVRTYRAQLFSPHATVRHWVAVALSRLGAKAVDAITELALALKDPDEGVRMMSAHALGNIGPAAGPALGDLFHSLDDRSADVRMAAAGALARIDTKGRRCVPGLIGAVRDDSARVRCEAVDALGSLGAQAAQAVAHLVRCLQDRHAEVRFRALQALERAMPAGYDLAMRVARCLEDADTGVRCEAIQILHRLGDTAAPAAPQILAALSDKEPTVRYYAIEILERTAPKNPTIHPAISLGIENCLKDPSKMVQTRAVTAVGRVGTWINRPHKGMWASLQSPFEEHRAGAVQAFAELRYDHPEALEALRRCVSDESGMVRVEACKALLLMGTSPQALLPTLAGAFNDEHAEVQASAIEVVGGLGSVGAGALGALRVKLSDSSPKVRKAAHVAIERIRRSADAYVVEP